MKVHNNASPDKITLPCDNHAQQLVSSKSPEFAKDAIWRIVSILWARAVKSFISGTKLTFSFPFHGRIRFYINLPPPNRVEFTHGKPLFSICSFILIFLLFHDSFILTSFRREVCILNNFALFEKRTL